MNTAVLDDLARYVRVLSASLEKTRHPHDRSLYLQHLATAAEIFQSLWHLDLEEARQQVASEKRAFGWSFLPGDEGSAAESAFVEFEKLFKEKMLNE